LYDDLKPSKVGQINLISRSVRARLEVSVYIAYDLHMCPLVNIQTQTCGQRDSF